MSCIATEKLWTKNNRSVKMMMELLITLIIYSERNRRYKETGKNELEIKQWQPKINK